jgi:hypothetical protein
MTHEQVKHYCLNRLTEIREIMKLRNPWGFVCAAAFIDLLSKINKGTDEKRAGYKDFIIEWLPDTYKTFQYANGENDLPYQLYHIFRCGILHSFSFSPTMTDKDARKQSVIIAHECQKDSGDYYKNLENYNKNGMDAAIIIAENLCDDLNYAIDNMFKDKNVQRNSEKWVKNSPLIDTISEHGSLLNSQKILTTNTIHLSA